MDKFVKTVRRGKVIEIIMDRPPVQAINKAMNYALYDAFKVLQDDPELMVGIVTGTGNKVFSAGWDLKEVATGVEGAQGDQIDMGPGGIGGIATFWDLTKPVIAALNGHTVGGGFELALAADIIIAADHIEFFLPEMKLGFVPDGGGVQRLPHRIPYNVAIDLLLTGRHMPAQEAKQWGLVREVVPGHKLMDRAREIGVGIADSAPLAVQALKEVLSATSHLSVKEAFAKIQRGWTGESGMPIFDRQMRSEDFLEGPRSFNEKRKPVWKGR